jgi:gas vesicle protein
LLSEVQTLVEDYSSGDEKLTRSQLSELKKKISQLSSDHQIQLQESTNEMAAAVKAKLVASANTALRELYHQVPLLDSAVENLPDYDSGTIIPVPPELDDEGTVGKLMKVLLMSGGSYTATVLGTGKGIAVLTGIGIAPALAVPAAAAGGAFLGWQLFQALRDQRAAAKRALQQFHDSVQAINVSTNGEVHQQWRTQVGQLFEQVSSVFGEEVLKVNQMLNATGETRETLLNELTKTKVLMSDIRELRDELQLLVPAVSSTNDSYQP